MHLAILGATSQIAQDFVTLIAPAGDFRFSLFARQPDAVERWVSGQGLRQIEAVHRFSEFGRVAHYDGIINFVGVGNPLAVQTMGASIFDITFEFDSLVLSYLKGRPDTRYIFLSSGAVYGSDFSEPATADKTAQFRINRLLAQEWYGAAKFHAECCHRAQSHLPIVDVRVFNYFSRTQDMSSRFLITDILRTIRDKEVLKTSPDYIVRDFLHPSDFFRLIQAVLDAPPANAAVDCYTRDPIDKPTLLAAMQDHFGLRYEIADADARVNVTGDKPLYYSLNRRAADFGYQPSLTSWEGVQMEAHAILKDYL